MLVFGNIKLDDTTFLVEIIEILHFVPIEIVNQGVIKWNENFLQVDFLNSPLNIALILSVNGDLAVVSLSRGFLDVDLNTELILYALDLRTL